MKANKEVVMSMVNPSTDALMKRVKSRYGLVVLGAKRARQLLDGEELKATQARSTKNVTNALEEIVEGKIGYSIDKTVLSDHGYKAFAGQENRGGSHRRHRCLQSSGSGEPSEEGRG